MKDKTTAGLLALFLGGIGVQFFYLRKEGAGIICILFFWTFIPSIIGLIQGIQYLTMDDRVFNALHNPSLNQNMPHYHNPNGYGAQNFQYSPSSAYNTQGQPVVNNSFMNKTEELERLYSLKEKGIITEQEYQVQKERILA